MKPSAETNRARGRARQRAYVALAEAHPEEFRVLLDAERAKEGLPPAGELIGETGGPAANRSKERYPSGHDYAEYGATYVDSAGYEHRQCRACQRDRARDRAIAKKSGALGSIGRESEPASAAAQGRLAGVNAHDMHAKASAAPESPAKPAVGATTASSQHQPALAGTTRS